jgi:hypothetical protein
MNVLVGCEFSGIVREEFKKLGHNAWSCDLLDTEIPGQHYKCDILESFNKKVWDIIIIHLPCTKIALCGNSTYGKGMRKHSERIESIYWTKNVYETARQFCDKVVFENPKNVMGKYIGKHTQTIQPYQFGHLEKKETWLWILGLPNLVSTNCVYEEMMLLPKKERERIHYMSPSKVRGMERSRTYLGIAKAMANQWSC